MNKPTKQPEFDTTSLELLKRVGELADKEGLKVYSVGGSVRDWLMERPSTDVDIMVVGDGIGFANSLARMLGVKKVVAYKQFGTAMLHHKGNKIEVSSARSESYSPDSRKPAVEPADVDTDLSRRDFTINAIAVGLNADSFGEVTDPFDGRGDIEGRIIRTPLEAEETFSDDPLRMLRAIRMSAQLGFEVEKGALKAIRETRERLSIVSQERKTEELLKMLGARKPSVAFAGLLGTGLLEVTLPELMDMVGVEERQGYHHKDVFWHTLQVVDNVAEVTDSIDLRFTALVHDIAKPATKAFRSGTGWTFHGHERVGVDMIRKLGRRLKLPTAMIKYAQKLTDLHLRPIALAKEGVTDSAIRRLIVDAGEEIDDLLALCRADITTQREDKVKQYRTNFDRVALRVQEVLAIDAMRAFQSPVRGDEIMDVLKIEPGPLVGKIKSAIEDAILEGEIPNEHAHALAWLVERKEEWVRENKR